MSVLIFDNPGTLFDATDRRIYEEKPYSVMCDLCGVETRDSEAGLRRAGWFLGNGMEICPKHD
jgi:hypothetical protein